MARFNLICAVLAATAGVTTAAEGSLRVNPVDTVRKMTEETDRPGLWVSCGNDFEECRHMPQDRQVWVRYGTENGRKYYKRAFQKAHCSPGYFGGDPVHNQKKTCEFFNYGSKPNETQADDEYDLWHQQEFSFAADEGHEYHVPPGVYTVRYGPINGPYLFTQVGTYNTESIYECKGFHDIAQGLRKYCYLSGSKIQGEDLEEVKEDDWQLCASEGQTCNFDADESRTGGYLVRWGLRSAKFFYYRTSSSLYCGKNSFNNADPVRGQIKTCEVLKIKSIV
mmetsp:Transcript_30154/g.47997  ORF Transcript_30154/g.47997 Transcript_30154/m.47997 type:complete len:280 (+) Transcript_30154:166-1005(+)